jgi:hypothetical protein
VARLATGFSSLDQVLEGGLPRGWISEITGPVTSGRTMLLMVLLAATTRRGEVAALIDFPNALHPETARSAGVELTHLLWVRPPSLKDGICCAELLLKAGGFGLVALDLGEPPPWQLRAPIWPRLARAAKRAGSVVALVGHRRVAGSFAAMSLTTTALNRFWTRGTWPLFEGIQLQLTVVRNKLGAPGQSTILRGGAIPSLPEHGSRS